MSQLAVYAENQVMEDILFIKANVDILSGLDDITLAGLANEIEHATYKKDSMIMVRGQFSDGLSVIKKGKVVVWVRTNPKKTEMSPVAELKAGDFFGEMSLLEDNSAMASVRAAEDGTDILTIPSASFQKLLEMQPQLRLALLAKIAARRPAKK